jgi:hypothetical protein
MRHGVDHGQITQSRKDSVKLRLNGTARYG